MTDLFMIYQDNLKNKLHKIDSNLSRLEAPLIIPSSQNQLFSDIEVDLTESEKLIKNLEIQINTSINIKDPNFILYLKNYKTRYESYKKKYMKLKNKYETENKMKHISPSGKDDNINNNLIDSCAYDSFQKLEQAKRTTIEIEGIGKDVMYDLNNQTHQMKNVNNKINNINDTMSSSATLLNEMELRNKKNKNIIIIVSIFLIILFFTIAIGRISSKFFHYNSSDNNNSNTKDESS